MSVGGVQWRRGYGSSSPGRRTSEQVPSAPPAPPQQDHLTAEEGDFTAGEGASGEGASNQGGGMIENLHSEFDLDNTTEVWPPVPLATREAPEAEPGTGAAGVWKATP